MKRNSFYKILPKGILIGLASVLFFAGILNYVFAAVTERDGCPFEPPGGDDAFTPSVVKVVNGSDVYAVAYRARSGRPGIVKTFRIQSDGLILKTGLNCTINASYTFNDPGKDPRIIHVAGNTYAIVYTNGPDQGWLQTIDINSTGTSITLRTQVQVDTTGKDLDILRLPTSSDIFALAYQGPGNDGIVKTYRISADGLTITPRAVSIFEPGTLRRARIINVAGTNYYAIAYGEDAQVRTVSITPDGSTITNAGFRSFEAAGVFPDIIRVGTSGNTYAIFYRGSSSRGKMRTFSINTSTGAIGGALNSLDTFDSGNLKDGSLDAISLGANNKYAVAYEISGGTGTIKVFTIDPSGNPISIDETFGFGSGNGSTPMTPVMVPVGGSYVAVLYSDTGSDGIVKSLDFVDHVGGGPPPVTGNPGMLVYGQDGQTAPRYRLFDGTDLASEQNALSGEGGHGETQFIDIANSPLYKQKLLVEQTSAGHIRAMVWDGFTSSWSLGAGAPANGDFAAFSQASPTTRAYGVAYEGLSGEALLVYENSAANDRSFGYAVWNGASWSSGTYNYETAGCPSPSGFFINDRVQWMKAKGQGNGNDILIWFSSDSQKDAWGVIWNGDTNTFQNCASMTNNTGLIQEIPAENFDLAWETNSKDAMVVWGQAQIYNYKTFSGGAWSGSGQVVDMANDVQNMEIAPDPTSDYIAFIGGDLQTTNDMEIRIWNGSNWTSIAVPDQLGDAPPIPSLESVNAKRVALAWERNSDQALFAFVKNNERYIDYFSYDRSDNTFTCPETGQVVINLGFDEGAGGPCNTQSQHEWEDDVGPIRVKQDPFSNDIFLMAANDRTLDIRLDILVWRGDVNAFYKPPSNTPETDISPGTFTNPQAHAFDFAFDFGTQSPGFDCGLRYRHLSGTILVVCEPAGVLTSALRIRKGSTTYGIILVDVGDANASHIRIQMNSGIKALKKF